MSSHHLPFSALPLPLPACAAHFFLLPVTFTYALIPPYRLTMPSMLYDPGISHNSSAGVDAALTAVVVTESSPSEYIILDGCKRVAAHSDGNRPILCAVLDSETIPDVTHRGIIRILLNCLRPHHLRETYTIIQWIDSQLSEELATKLYNTGYFMKHERDLCRTITAGEQQTRTLIFEERIHKSLIPHVVALRSSDQNAFCSLFTTVSLSFQIQKHLLEWLPEIAVTRHCSVADILSLPLIRNLLDDTRSNGPQKVKKLYEILTEMKFPRYTAALKKWEKNVTAINPDPTHIRFTHSEAFEHNKLTITLEIPDGAVAQNTMHKLAAISQEHWQNLISPT